jgi:DNA-directed RNA polymerase specialized sigma24 family protein
MEIPLGTVKSRVYYAERKLRERLKRFVGRTEGAPNA